MVMRRPAGLGSGGSALWRDITAAHDLDAAQIVQLTEACRAKDRLDKLDEVLRGDANVWCEILSDFDGNAVSLRIDAALDKANATANMMKQLLAAMRLPDESGKRPQVSRKRHRLGGIPSHDSSATSNNCTAMRPTSRRTHRSKIVHRNAP